MKAVIFRHSPGSIGTFATTLAQAGVQYTILDTWRDGLPGAFDALTPDLLIVMGGAPDPYQAAVYPFLRDELKILEQRLAKDLPTLGICLGAQMIAAALGARTYRDDRGQEIGWHDLHVNDAGRQTPIRHLDAAVTKVAQSHGATFDLPTDTTLLASSDLYPNQIFSYGKRTLGLQCHPETDAEILAARYVSYAGAARGGLDLDAWRNETKKYLPVMMRQSHIMLTEWVEFIKNGQLSDA